MDHHASWMVWLLHGSCLAGLSGPFFGRWHLGMTSIFARLLVVPQFGMATYDSVYIYIHDYIYMVIDLKVLVRSFNCESRACYVGNPRESFFFEFAKVKFYFAKVSRKLGIIIIICKGLPPAAARGPAGEGHQRMRVAVAKFPKVRLCESQTPRPLVFAFPSVHPLLMAGVCE